MKKITFLFFAIVVIHSSYFSQSVVFTHAPLGPTTTQVRAPNGTSNHAFLRACSLVLPSELTSLANGSTISSFGFTLSAGTGPLAVAGNFTIYLQNTSDVTYQKTTSWATIITGMTTVYASTMTIPASAGATSITVTLSSPFVYTGGGIYVAYDWNMTSTPNSLTLGNIATYYAEGTALATGGCSSAANITSPATTLGTTAFRPSFLFGVSNPYSNDLEIDGITAPGKVAGTLNTPHNITAIVKNSGYSPQSNITVSLNVTGANPFTDTQTISLATGASTTVTFSFNPLTAGTNSITVSVPADNNNVNNSGFYPQVVSCNIWAQNPATGANTYTNNSIGFGTGAGIIATPYSGAINSTLSGLRLAISTDANSTGKSVYGVALSSAGVVLATTNTIVITNTMLATFQNVSFPSPPTFTTGATYYLGFAQIANATAYYPAGALNSSYVKPNTYYTAGITGGAYSPLATSFGYVGIEGVFSPTVALSVTPSQTIICGNTVSLSAAGADSYLWSTGAISSSIAVTPTANTVYEITAGSLAGCSASLTTQVVVDALPVMANISSNTVCISQSVNLTASGADSYIWGTSTGTLSTSSTFSIIPQGGITTYTLLGFNSAGCSATAAINATVNPLPTVTANATSTVICEGDQITLTGGGADTYVWTGNVIDGTAFTPTLSDTYTVTGTNTITGCSNWAAATVTINALPTVTANATSTLICQGDQITLTGNGADTYVWTGSVTDGAAFTPTLTDTYTVTGTNTITGCSNWAAATVTINPLPTVTANATSTVICEGDQITLTGSGADTYVWTGNVIDGTAFTPTLSDTYTVTGTNTITGCSNWAAATVTVNSLPTVTANATSTVICQGDQITLTGNGADTYVWTGSVIDGTAFTPTLTDTYTVTGTNTITGCSNWAAATVTVNSLPTVTANATNTVICQGEQITLTGNGADTYVWTGGLTNGSAFTPTLTDTYTVTGTNTITGCSNWAAATITVSALPVVTANATNTVICQGGQITLTGNGANTYIWTGSVTDGAAFTPTLTDTYTVTGTNTITGCSNWAAATVTVNTLPIVTANATNTVICQGDQITLTGNGADTYVWTGSVIDGTAFTPTLTNTYTVTGTNTTGCSNWAAVTVTVNALPVITINATNTVICEGEQITLTGNGADTYVWTGGVTNGSAFTPTLTDTYTVTGTNALTSCSNTDIINIQLNVCTGVEKLVLNTSSFLIFPNPNNGNFMIRSSIFPAQLILFDIAGRVVMNKQITEMETTCNLSQLENGIYNLNISTGNEAINYKIIISK